MKRQCFCHTTEPRRAGPGLAETCRRNSPHADRESYATRRMARGKKEPAPPRSLFNSSGGAVIKVDANARATPRVAHGLNDLEGHCARLQALLSQVPAAAYLCDGGERAA